MILRKLILITPGGAPVGGERLTALGERDSAVRDTEPRAGVALLPIRYLDS